MAKRGRKPHYENATSLAEKYGASNTQIECRLARLGIKPDITFGRNGRGYGRKAVKALAADIRRNPFTQHSTKAVA